MTICGTYRYTTCLGMHQIPGHGKEHARMPPGMPSTVEDSRWDASGPESDRFSPAASG
ncbi:hypothetical protein Hjap01_01912 [Haloarcula japonica]